MRQAIAWLLAITSMAIITNANAALSFWKKEGVLIIYGEAVADDVAKLKEQLSPELRTVILKAPTGTSWTVSSAMASLIEDAKVTTVAFGQCYSLTCSALFIAGKQRMFPAAGRPEAHYVRLIISDEYFPDSGDDKGRPWSDVMYFWRDHTALGRRQTTPRHKDTFRPSGLLPSETKMFFHPSAKTSKGNYVHCWGKNQGLNQDCESMSSEGDALTLGIITTADLYQIPSFLTVTANEVTDIKTPKPTGVANISDVPLARISDNCLKIYKEDFLRLDSPRAFVVSSGGACYSRGAQNLRPYASAMDACKKGSPTYTCDFYAVDDMVVYSPAATAVQTLTLTDKNLVSAVTARKVNDDGVEGVTDTFSLEGKVFMRVAMRWDEAVLLGPQDLETKWYINDREVSTYRSRLSEPSKHSASVWHAQNTADLGVGKARVDFYCGGKLIATKSFSIVEKL